MAAFSLPHQDSWEWKITQQYDYVARDTNAVSFILIRSHGKLAAGIFTLLLTYVSWLLMLKTVHVGSHGIRARLYGCHILWVLVTYTYDENAFPAFSNCTSNKWIADNHIRFVKIEHMYLGCLIIIFNGECCSWLPPNREIVTKLCGSQIL